MRARWFVLIGAVIGGLGAIAWVMGRPRVPVTDAPPVVGTDLFQDVFSHVRAYAVDSVGDQEIYRRAAAGIIDELDDPYAVLTQPGQSAPPANDLPVQGLYLDRRDGVVVIVAVVPGSPAATAGVRAGDRLVGVDTIPVDETRMDEVAKLVDGPADSKASLRLRRTGVRTTLSQDLVRGPAPAASAVETTTLPGGVGRLTVRRFPKGIPDSVRQGVESLRASGARSLVLDLRNAVGGTLEQGVALADLFLDAGRTIVDSKGREGATTQSYRDSTTSPFDSLPLAILVDAGTAGAAELVAGALQDHDRAAVLGQISFGRGVTQSTFPLGEGASLRLTTSLWMTPSGRQIQRPPRPLDGDSVPRPKVKSDGGRSLVGGGGIVPDRLVAETGSTDLALAAARDILLKGGSTRAVLALVALH